MVKIMLSDSPVIFLPRILKLKFSSLLDVGLEDGELKNI